MKINQLLLALIFTFISSSSWAHSADITCGDQLFSITRTDGFHGDLFLWKFSGHLLEHLQGNNVLTPSTRVQTGDVSYSHLYFDQGTAGINVGASYGNFTKTEVLLNNSGSLFIMKLVKDLHSNGYFIRVFHHSSEVQVAEYYFSNCQFSESYQAQPQSY